VQVRRIGHDHELLRYHDIPNGSILSSIFPCSHISSRGSVYGWLYTWVS